MALVQQQITSLGLTATPAVVYPFLRPSEKPTFIPPDKTTIFGWFTDPSGDLLCNVSIVATTKEKIESGSVIIEKGMKEETTTDASGYFELCLVQGQYNLVTDCKHEYCLSVPKSTDPVNLQDLI